VTPDFDPVDLMISAVLVILALTLLVCAIGVAFA
jgi:hypothetical protein